MKKFLKNFSISLMIVWLAAGPALAVTANKVWRVPSGASVPAWGAVNLASSNAVSGQLARTNLPTVGQQTSSSISQSTSSTSFSDISGASITLTTSGRPVFVGLVASGVGNSQISTTQTSSGALAIAQYKLIRDSTDISSWQIGYNITGTSGGTIEFPPSFTFVDPVGAGTYTYKFQFKVNTSNNSTTVTSVEVFAYEL